MKPVSVAIVVSLAVSHVWAQTPAQMEYERQQREARAQQERQQQEQQRQQQIQQENARRQQEEMNRLNRPAPSSTIPSQGPGYPTTGSGASQTTPSRSSSPSAPQRKTAKDRGMFEPPDSPEWAKLASAADGDLYGDVAGDARNRTGTIALAWVMRDFKKVQETGDGARYLSTREKLEFICDDKIMRSWLVERYAGRMGAGTVVSMTKSGKRSPVTEKDAAFMKFACAAKPTAP